MLLEAMTVLGLSVTIRADQVEPYRIPSELAADLVGTWQLESDTQRREGRRIGCTVRYRLGIQDFVYAGGDVMIVDGNFGILRAGDGIIGHMKVVGSDLYLTEAGYFEQPINNPVGYLLDAEGNGPVQALDSITCDSGGVCIATEPGLVFELVQRLMQRGSLDGGLSRVAGGADIQFTVRAADTNWDAREFLECAAAVIGVDLDLPE